MNLLRRARLAFSLSEDLPTHSDESTQQLARQVVSRHSHGNIRLQQGKYVTKGELDEEVNRARSFRFDDV